MRKLPVLLAVVCVASLPSIALSAETEIGQQEFRLRCAACHGPAGGGDGIIGQMLKVPPPDLTRIAERNGGTFPFKKVYDIIDGRTQIAAHGTKEMPIWGDHYRADQFPAKDLDSDATERQVDAPERKVEENILKLVYFVGTLQAQK